MQGIYFRIMILDGHVVTMIGHYFKEHKYEII